MYKTLIPFEKIPQLAKTDLAYASGDPALRPFYRYEPRFENFPAVIRDKQSGAIPRETLVQALREQYKNLPPMSSVDGNIDALAQPDTFTVTTAHQPTLLLGPLYFLYKALTAINLAGAVQAGAGQRIVPVFVLGSEDHDLDELNHIHLFNKRLEWNPGPEASGGAVGSMRAESLRPVLDEIKTLLGESENARDIFARIERAYTTTATFAEATQALLHDLLGRFGLVVLDLNRAALKRLFIPVLRAELTQQISFELVQKTSGQLNALGFKTQAAPRPINLFYLQPGRRERIVLENGIYKVLNSNLIFSENEILAEVENHPERFSPNVVLRPLYQEMILPNLAYIGGGGELAYWLERKAVFEHFGVNFPMLVRRNSALWIDRDGAKKLQKFGFTAAQFFADTDTLIRRYIAENAAGEVNLAAELDEVKSIFERLAQKAAAIDPTLENAVRADGVKAAAGLEQWQNRLVRAEKQKHEVVVNQIRAGKEKLFPGGSLQERHDNFLPYFLKYGERFLDELKENLLPLEAGFVVLEDQV